MTRRHHRHETGLRNRRLLAQAELADPDLSQEERLINLEVELSYSAGMAGAAGAIAWYLYEYAKLTGMTSLLELLYAVLLVTVVEVFALGLAMHLIYRGIWMAIRVFSRVHECRWPLKDPEVSHYQRSMLRLDHVCSTSFYYAFHYLYRGGQVCLFLGALLLTGSDSWMMRVVSKVFLGGLALYCLLLVPGLLSRMAWARDLALRFETASDEVERALGLWWVHPPVQVSTWATLRHQVLAVLATFLLYFHNLQGAYQPRLHTDEEIYARHAGGAVVLTYHQSGLRGNAESEQLWTVDASFRPLPDFRRLRLNHHVAVVPLEHLEPGVHWVEALLELSEGSKRGTGSRLSLRPDPVRITFLVRP